MSDESSRVNFSNLTEEVLSAVAMEPGDGVKLHFKNNIDCPEANTCLNHLATHRNHFIDDPTTVQGCERLKQKIRGQYISPEKQKEVAEWFLASQGRGCGMPDMSMFELSCREALYVIKNLSFADELAKTLTGATHSYNRDPARQRD